MLFRASPVVLHFEVIMNHSLVELRKKPHLSVSAVKTFLLCPMKFCFRYTRRIRPDYIPAALVLGTAWHAVVATWLESKTNDDALDEELRAQLRDRLALVDVPVLFSDSEMDQEQFISRAVDMFQAFRRSVARPNVVVGTELPFDLEIVHPLTGECLPTSVIGAIDAIVVQADGRRALWELKTGRRWGSTTAEHDLQTTLYHVAARELGHEDLALRVIVTTKSKVPEVQEIEIERTAADEVELAEVFLEVHRAIQAGVSFRQRGWQCSTCEYSTACRP